MEMIIRITPYIIWTLDFASCNTGQEKISSWLDLLSEWMIETFTPLQKISQVSRQWFFTLITSR